jgi:ADP-ribose pyrophosphatase YjhB (NUDIX family)
MGTPGVIGVIFSKNRTEVLLIKRRDVPVWVLPGGGIEKNELPEKAIVREIKEETGLKVKIKKQVGIYYPINRLSRLTYLYECLPLEGQLEIGEETKEIIFFSIKNLPKYLPPPFVSWIYDAHKNLDHIIKKKLTNITYLSLIKNLVLHPILVIRFLLSRFGFYINT